MGIIPLDFLYTVKRLPKAGEKIDALKCCVQGGGPVPNTMVGLSRLGMKTAVIGVVGDDPTGRVSIDELAKENVDHRFLIVKKQRSATAFGMIEADTGRRTIALYRDINITPRDLRISDYPLPRVLHLDGRDLQAAIRLAKWARRMRIPVSFDIGSVRNDVSAILPLVDHLVVADAFAYPFTGARTAAGAIQSLTAYCPGSIVITEGLKGATGRDNKTPDEFVCQAAFKVTCVDATGAGDSFHAGYLYGLLKGYDMAQRLRFGAATAALKCTRPGARTGAPGLRQVQAFLKNGPDTYA